MAMKKVLAFVISTALLASTVFGCSSSPSASANAPASTGTSANATQTSKPYKIGILLQMTGELGNKLRLTVQKAFDDINKAGGINGHQVQLVIYDSNGEASKATDAFNRLISQDKVLVTIGPTTSTETIGVIGMAKKNKIALITPQATSTAITKTYGNEWFFRMSCADVYGSYSLCDYVCGDLGKKKVGIIHETEALGVGQASDFETRMKKYNLTPVDEEKYALNDVDYKSQMLKIKNADPDVLVMAGHEADMSKCITQAYDIGFSRSIPKCGFSSMSSTEYFSAAGQNATGSIFVSTFSASDDRPDIKKFVEEYEPTLKQKPDHNHAQAYDTVQIVKNAMTGLDIKNTDDSLEADRTLIRDALATKTVNYQGLSGTCTFGKTGSPQDRDGLKACNIYSLNSDGSFKLLKRAS